MPPDDRLIYLIFTAQQKLRNHLANVMMRENVRVTPAQAGILFLLAEKDGRTMSELSRILSIDNSTLTGLVDRLEKAGLARRRARMTAGHHTCISARRVSRRCKRQGALSGG